MEITNGNVSLNRKSSEDKVKGKFGIPAANAAAPLISSCSDEKRSITVENRLL